MRRDSAYPLPPNSTPPHGSNQPPPNSGRNPGVRGLAVAPPPGPPGPNRPQSGGTWDGDGYPSNPYSQRPFSPPVSNDPGTQ